MNDNEFKHSCRKVFVYLLLVVLLTIIGIFIFRKMTEVPPPTTQQISGPTANSPEVDFNAVRNEAWHRIQLRLGEAGEKTGNAANTLVVKIESFFDSRKKRAPSFAESALSWKSKWELIKSREGHRKFLEEQFSKHIFNQEEFSALLEEAAVAYESEILSIDNQFLLNIQADLEDLPRIALPAFSNEQHLKLQYETILKIVRDDSARELKVDVAQEMVALAGGGALTLVVRKVLILVATRMGISGVIVASGTVASPATVGAGVVIAVMADMLVGWIIDWFHDPVESLSGKLSSSLDEVCTFITMGDPEAWKIRNKVEELANNHVNPDIRERAEEVLSEIEFGGALGLKNAFSRVVELTNTTRSKSLRLLVFEE